MTPDQVKALKPGEKAPLDPGTPSTTPLPGANKSNPPPIVPTGQEPFTIAPESWSSLMEAIHRLMELSATNPARFAQAIATLRELAK